MGTRDPQAFRIWVWKCFTRGVHPIVMDAIQIGIPGWEKEGWNQPDNPAFAAAREAMGQVCSYSERLELAALIPHEELSSTGFCLANPGREYIVFSTIDEPFIVDLSATHGQFEIEWFNPRNARAFNKRRSLVVQIAILRPLGGNKKLSCDFSALKIRPQAVADFSMVRTLHRRVRQFLQESIYVARLTTQLSETQRLRAYRHWRSAQTSLAQQAGDRPAPLAGVTVENPRLRVPLSFIIDDSTCLVNLNKFSIPQFAEAWGKEGNFQQDWRSWPAEIPDSFVRKFGEWSAENGVKGKYSIVPYPACVGRMDRLLPGWTRENSMTA
ncbi:MAG: hypothetical protein R3C56_34995 [Pirellulaceae bacterium]